MREPNNFAWLLVLPAFTVLGAVGVVPLITVFNFSFFDIFTLSDKYWVGGEWFAELVR